MMDQRSPLISPFKNVWGDSVPPTPFYAYGEKQLTELAEGFEHITTNRVFPAPLHLHFAMKSNHNPHLLKFFKERGIGVDLVSGGELKWAQRMGFAPEDMVFSGVGKTDTELEQALRAGVAMINAESAYELERISQLAQKLNCKAFVSLRVNPDVDAKTHPYISTGLSEHKFGVGMDEAFSLYKKWSSSPHLSWRGVSLHIGSQLMELEVLGEAIQKVLHFAEELKNAGIRLEVLDVGGGLGVDYKKPNTPPPFEKYGIVLQMASQAWYELQGAGAQIYSECGRALVAQAGYLVTRVIGTKRNGKKEFALVDASMSELLRPALYQAWHPVEFWEPSKDVLARPKKVYDIAGPVCESSDVIAFARELPELHAGDLLVIGCAGAYGYVMSSTYNARPLPAEWWISRDDAAILSRASVDPFATAPL